MKLVLNSSGSNMALEKFDVVIVGAGTAGCLAAKVVGKAGYKVCLIDTKKKEEIGQKICGDALGEHHLTNLSLEKPGKGELTARIEGVKIYSPDLETVFTIEHEDFTGYMLNRRLFGQWLLKHAIDEGSMFLDSTQCLEPIIQKSFVVGVLAKKKETGKTLKLRCRVVVDASGFLAVIRRKLPNEMNVEKKIANGDLEACYREIRQLDRETENTKYCEIYLNHKVAPGGYSWIFPKGDAIVNAGLGVRMQRNFPAPKKRFNRFVVSKPIFKGSILREGGTWYVPTRKPIDNMVGNGVIITGDAACLVNPIHGGGIGPSMLSGDLAGKTINDAFENGTVNREALWPYNYMYMKEYGMKQGGLDVFRMLLLASRNDDLNFGMKHKLLTEKDVLKATLNEKFRLNITDASKRIFKGLRKINYLNKLRLTAKFIDRVKAHYSHYPKKHAQFKEWQIETTYLFQRAQSAIME
jgi:geranylgeranyl reductase family protein